MATSLTITDNSDGSGATATVSGSSGGANVVYVQNVDGELGSGTWAAAGSITGDGTLTLALAKGYYWGYCLTAGAPSNFCYFAVTDGLDSVISRCAAAVKSRLQLLDLPFTRRVFDSINEKAPGQESYPCTILTTDGARQTNPETLNGRDDLGQPIRCIVKDHGAIYNGTAADLDKRRKWRQAVFRAFHNQRLPGVIESVRCLVEMGPVTEFVDGMVITVDLTIRCITREVRGLGA